MPGRARRADLLDAAFLGGTAAHGIELDDGYTKGSVHPGCAVVPAVLARRLRRQSERRGADRGDGRRLRDRHRDRRAPAIPTLRQRGFHPTGAVGVFGAAMAAGKLRGLTAAAVRQRLGIAASSAAGLFAFVNGGADIKRLHAGHASREGLQAALLAEQGVEGPPGVIEARDGFMQAFAFGRSDKARAIVLPPAVPFGITDCYIKPNPCCRHIQPAMEALIGLLNDEKIASEEVEHVDVETYRIAAEHAAYRLGRLRQRAAELPLSDGAGAAIPRHQVRAFRRAMRRDPAFAALARKLRVSAPPEIDRLYPQLRPARVTVTTARGTFTRQADEALGSRLVPLDDAGLQAKFLELVAPVHGGKRADDLAERLWAIGDLRDVSKLVADLAKQPSI